MDGQAAVQGFRNLVEDPTTLASRRFRAACALAILDPPRTPEGETRWSRQVDWVVREALNTASAYGEDIDRTLSPLEGLYLRAVGRCCRDGDPQRAAAFRLLRLHADRTRRPNDFFAQARPVALILDAEPEDFEWLLKVLGTHLNTAVASLSGAAADPDALFNDEPAMKGHDSKHRQARALIALARLGRADAAWPPLRRSPEPDLRTWLGRDLSRYGVRPTLLIARLRTEADSSIRAALVLALGGYDPGQIDRQAHHEVEAILLDWYRHDPDQGLHGAIAWLLRARWNQGEALRDIDRAIQSRDPAGTRGWFVNGRGETFTLVRDPQQFRMGSASGEKEQLDPETPHDRVIPRSFAIATTEVTVARYREFVQANRAIFSNGLILYPRVSPTDDCPVHGVSWFEAILYCRWLSDQEKIPEEQMCFPPIPDLLESLRQGRLDLGRARLQRAGYRLPSEAEWEFACRAGTTTSWFFGRASSLLPEYARFLGNSGAASPAEAESQGRTDRVGRLKPNDLGLFDVYGNVREWCLDAFKPYPNAQGAVVDATFQDPATVGDYNRVARGGSFADPAGWTRSAFRNGWVADQHVLTIGFRVARTVR
jgi:formylglycine-generating enzyme required for sulfatase activity